MFLYDEINEVVNGDVRKTLYNMSALGKAIRETMECNIPRDIRMYLNDLLYMIDNIPPRTIEFLSELHPYERIACYTVERMYLMYVLTLNKEYVLIKNGK